MALIIPPGFLQAAYVFKLQGDSEDIVTTCGHEIGSASGANLEDAADDLFGAFNTRVWQTYGSNVYTLDHVVVYGGNDGPTIVNISTATPAVGPATGAVLPQNCAYLARKRTDLGGRRGRGRMYLPSAAEANVDHVGDLGTLIKDVLQPALDDWHAFLTAGAGARLYPPVVLHRAEGLGTEPPPTPITRFTIADRIATQRRRLRP